MMQPALITTPIPTVDEFAKKLGISEARKNAIIRIMTEGSAAGRRRKASPETALSRPGNRKKSRDRKSAKRTSKRV